MVHLYRKTPSAVADSRGSACKTDSEAARIMREIESNTAGIRFSELSRDVKRYLFMAGGYRIV